MHAMTRIMLSLWFTASAAQAADVPPDCQYSEAPRAMATVAKTRLDLVRTIPAEGGDVRRDSIVVAEVEFEIADFEPDRYRLYPVFTVSGFSSTSPVRIREVPVLKSSAGRAHICVPVDELYDNTTVLWPLTMRVSLLRDDGYVTGDTAEIRFNSPDVPKGALERQAAAPPEEYYDVMRKVSAFFDTRRALYKVCILKYPAMQEQMTKAYRAWGQRHRAQSDLVDQVHFEYLKAVSSGSAELAARVQDVMQEALYDSFRDMPALRLKGRCDDALADFADTEDRASLAIVDEMEQIRRYSSPSPERSQ